MVAKEMEAEIEYQLEEVNEGMKESRGSRFNLIAGQLGIGVLGRRSGRETLIIAPDNRWYRQWTKLIVVLAVYSSVFTPFEFGFFRGLPENLFLLDVAGQIAFLIDIVVKFLLAYRDPHTYRIVSNPASIAIRYLKSGFVFDFLACLPWDAIYKACNRKEEVRYLLWIRLVRVVKVTQFLTKMEKDIRINYLFTRIVKLIFVELYCTHTAACIFYYLATTLPASMEGHTWIGSLKLGDYSFENFRDIDLSKRYLTSLYFSIVTMATVGYGDIHAVNPREMLFVMIYVSLDMILGAYLIGNMTALIVKGSKTEKFRDKMKDLIKYMNRNKLDKDIREQIKGHVRLQYESSYTEASVLQDIPASIRAKISQSLYKPYIEDVPLFSGCSAEFIDQIAIRLHEEFFLPGEVIMEQGNAVDQLYFVCHGVLEGVAIGEDGTETIVPLEPNSSFGEIAILCNIPQPFTVRVCELCRLLRIDKQLFTNILEIYFVDGRTILSNLLEGNENNIKIKQFESDINLHITKQESELSLRVNSAAFHNDLNHLKSLIKAGADPKKTDYDGRSPLHLAASRGHEDMTSFLIQEGVDINLSDKFGNTALYEAIKNGHDRVASMLYREGGRLSSVGNGGVDLCMAVAKGNVELLRRMLVYGMDPNGRDYDQRTALHIAAAEGLHFMANMLLSAGASPASVDRWGNTPLEEARRCGSKSLITLLEGAESNQLTPGELQGHINQRRCTVFPFHPWDPKDKRKEGVMLWVPNIMEDLIKSSMEQLQCSTASSYIILSEDGARIHDAEMIVHDQRLYLIPDANKNTVE
ncbi:potassium channel KOR1-like [Dioscorea cayenensis subsp. rotundata]|uniref:Potassium channel n=1 Tax=Dioscorea cayennensis subsp. rotundata TaxID=55577 RepID=A0AB40BLW5_DIOCR|nr:potassium channel KOR1-like [Dioscorea cayenensis subsp. rotundata]